MVNLPLPLRHLQLRLHTLNGELNRAINDRREASRRQAVAVGLEPVEPTETKSDPFAFLQLLHALNPQARAWISDSQVDFLLSEVEALVYSEGELADEQTLRAQAKHQRIALPLDRLESEVPLSPTQMDALILCAAPEFDPAYETLYAYILNDVSRRMPCPELFCALRRRGRRSLRSPAGAQPV